MFTYLGIIVNCTLLGTLDIMQSILPNQNKYEVIVIIIIVEVTYSLTEFKFYL